MFLQAGFQYRSMPNTWEVPYYGITLEVPITEQFGLSGSVFFGEGSNGTDYLHLPVPGFFLFLIINTVFGFEPSTFQFLMVEDFHYYHRINDNLWLSPYLNVLGADLGDIKGGKYEDKGHILLTWGPGISLRTIYKRFTLAADVGVKHFIIDGKDDFGHHNQLGVNIGINLGVVLD